MQIESWVFREVGKAMEREQRDELPQLGQVVVKVAGCGVCHTDLGFFYDGVPTRHALPLTLGHEVSGRVVEAGTGAESWIGKAVIVPAVIPCGECDACKAGRGSICPNQIFPGNDVHGGFASHLTVPAHGLCVVPDLTDPANNPEGVDLATLSVIADAVSTPYQAIRRSGLAPADLAVFVGTGGVGGFGVQLAAAMDAHVIAIDVDADKLERLREYGAHLVLRSDAEDFRSIKKAVRAFAAEHEIPSWRWRIFETSGHPEGQATAFGLMGHGSYLSIVGYTPAKTTLRLSNLMALDATAEGNWGCLPELYPEVLDMVLKGQVKLAPFTEHRPLSSINETFADVHAHRIAQRPILTPEH